MSVVAPSDVGLVMVSRTRHLVRSYGPARNECPREPRQVEAGGRVVVQPARRDVPVRETQFRPRWAR